MKIYLSGPMTGYANYNYPTFYAAAAALRALGHDVVNPAELDEPGHVPGEWTWAQYLKRDLIALFDCDAVATLAGWQDSRGATLECHVAEKLGLRISPLEAYLGQAVAA